jgi:seryl-tRNA synthetase
MIDLKLLRANPEAMKENIQKRNLNVDLTYFLELDKKLIELNQKLDEIRATKNSFSKLIPTLSSDEKTSKLAEMKAL